MFSSLLRASMLCRYLCSCRRGTSLPHFPSHYCRYQLKKVRFEGLVLMLGLGGE